MRGPLPLHMQISEMLIRNIGAGLLADGTRLPPEREMAAELQIAVGTLRRALQDLTDKGLLERVQGSGNYVRARADALGVYAFFRLEHVDGGGLPTAGILSVDTLPKPECLPDFGRSTTAHRIRRLRLIDGTAAALEQIWLDGNRAKSPNADAFSESLYLHYEQTLGFTIARAEDRISFGPTPDWAPNAFGVPTGGTAGYIERMAWANDGESVEFSQTWFDKDVARYVTRFR